MKLQLNLVFLILCAMLCLKEDKRFTVSSSEDSIKVKEEWLSGGSVTFINNVVQMKNDIDNYSSMIVNKNPFLRRDSFSLKIKLREEKMGEQSFSSSILQLSNQKMEYLKDIGESTTLCGTVIAKICDRINSKNERKCYLTSLTLLNPYKADLEFFKKIFKEITNSPKSRPNCELSSSTNPTTIIISKESEKDNTMEIRTNLDDSDKEISCFNIPQDPTQVNSTLVFLSLAFLSEQNDKSTLIITDLLLKRNEHILGLSDYQIISDQLRAEFFNKINSIESILTESSKFVDLSQIFRIINEKSRYLSFYSKSLVKGIQQFQERILKFQENTGVMNHSTLQKYNSVQNGLQRIKNHQKKAFKAIDRLHKKFSKNKPFESLYSKFSDFEKKLQKINELDQNGSLRTTIYELSGLIEFFENNNFDKDFERKVI